MVIDARVSLIGFPSVGKSTCNELFPPHAKLTSDLVLSKLTNTASEAAAYEFTTLTVCQVLLRDLTNR